MKISGMCGICGHPFKDILNSEHPCEYIQYRNRTGKSYLEFFLESYISLASMHTKEGVQGE